MSIADSTLGAAIYVTVNGSAVNTTNTGYYKPINLTGSATLQAIANGLNAGGVATPTGRQWSPALVRKIALQEPPVLAA